MVQGDAERIWAVITVILCHGSIIRLLNCLSLADVVIIKWSRLLYKTGRLNVSVLMEETEILNGVLFHWVMSILFLLFLEIQSQINFLFRST
jgi:hypothetical protein